MYHDDGYEHAGRRLTTGSGMGGGGGMGQGDTTANYVTYYNELIENREEAWRLGYSVDQLVPVDARIVELERIFDIYPPDAGHTISNETAMRILHEIGQGQGALKDLEGQDPAEEARNGADDGNGLTFNGDRGEPTPTPEPQPKPEPKKPAKPWVTTALIAGAAIAVVGAIGWFQKRQG